MSNNSNQEMLFRQTLDQKDEEIANLHDKIASLSNQLQTALQANCGGNNSNSKKKAHIPLSPHTINVREVRIGANKRTLQAQKERLGRNASITTQNVLETLHQQNAASGGDRCPPVVQRIMDMFQFPTAHMDYLNSEVFAKDLLKLAHKACQMLEREPRVVFVQSPCYVFGDIHGNLEDLHFFSDNLWRLGMSLTAGNFLFLGDYVDRGIHCLECIAYLLAVKYQLPSKVFLLRGNHETRDVNGWEEHYAERSFIYQCRVRFGDELGYKIWEGCNQVFDRMPLAAVIDQDIFCVHGGIPRPIAQNTTRIQDILTVPRVAGINPPYQHEDDAYQQVASDCIWSDPASNEQEMTTVDPESGFGESLRGGGAICFGHKAVTNFLAQHDFSYIMRAHEAHAEGVAVSKGARVFTVFSTSQDHNQGNNAMAGCILVDDDKLQVINRSPAYKNQYIHRRDSISVANLSGEELAKRIQLGLVKDSPTAKMHSHNEDSDEDFDEWDDIEDIEEDAEGEVGEGGGSPSKDKKFVLQQGRRSSVDLSSMSGNIHDELIQDLAEMGAEHHLHDDASNKRHRSKRPSVSSIREVEEIDTERSEDDAADKDADIRDAYLTN